jgi:hypothetical protein
MITDQDNPPAPRATSAGELSRLAKVSCFAGILSLLGLAAAPPPFVLVFAVIAIICGHIARRRIRSNLAFTRGSGMALAGLILGYSSTYLAMSDKGDDRAINRAKTVITLATAI